MKTKRVRPALVESKDKITLNSIVNDPTFGLGIIIEKHGEECFYNTHSSGGSITTPWERNLGDRLKHYELILISLEDDKIEVGDEFIELDIYKTRSSYINKIYICDVGNTETFILTKDINFPFPENCKKVIARQFQIPQEYISKFVEQYNNDCIEDLEIEMEELYIYPDGTKSKISRLMPDAKPIEEPKLTNGFVTIIEKELERGIIITRVEEVVKHPYNLLCNMQYYMEYCQANGYITPQDWLNKFKHYSDRKEPITYTEEEVKSLCSEAYSLGLSSLKSEIPDLEEMMELDNWFNKNKKK